MGKTKPGVYAVARGRKVGVFQTWDDCKAQVNGFANARYKKFDTVNEAQTFIAENGNGGEPSGSATLTLNSASAPVHKPHFAALPPKHPDWKATNFIQHQHLLQDKPTPKPELKHQHPTTFERQYSGKRAYRPELLGNSSTSTVLASASASSSHQIIPQPHQPQAQATRNLSTSVAQFRRQLRVAEDRVINNKRKHGDGNQLVTANGNVTNLEQFTLDEEGYVVVFTDGACKANGKKGAVAGIGIWFGDNHDLNVSEPVLGRQTNNTAEIQAAERAISQAKNAGIDKLNVQTDSQFVINCVTKWVTNWKRNNWKLKDGKPVKNRADLEKLNVTMQNMEIKWSYVAGHKGHYGNEQADQLAVQGSNKRLKLSTT